jgi:multidrug efflux system membrane fusion protein
MVRFRLGIMAAVAAAAALHAVAAEPITVRPTEVTDWKAVFATVESVDLASARARIGGTVTALAIDEGVNVTPGQVIARVEDPKLKLRVAAVDARIQALVAQRDLARTALDRARSLRESGTVAQARLDEAQTNMDVVERELAAMRAERSVIQEQQGEGDVLAPKAGRVLKVRVTEGAVVMPGESLAEIATERYVLRLSLPERHARFIHEGDEVRVGPRGMAAGGDGELGRVRQIYPEIQQGRVVADVEVGGLGDFFVGERIGALVGAGRRSTFVVPASYVYQRQGVSFVRLASGIEAVVQPGQETEGGIEILSGLRDGDVIQPAGR